MTRFLFLILFSINFWSCDDKEEATDSIPPNIEITYPPNNSTVSEIVNISCTTHLQQQPLTLPRYNKSNNVNGCLLLPLFNQNNGQI